MLFEETYNTIGAPSQGSYREKGSRFLSFAFPVSSETMVKELLNRVRSEHSRAQHHCYAFRLGPGKAVYRYSDDREPSGSAGKPIYGVIQSNDLTDILIVVARYFGGTLLGVPGLIHAYRTAAQEAISQGSVLTRMVMERYRIRFGYDVMNLVMDLVKRTKARVLSQLLDSDCVVEIELPGKAADEFISKLRNQYQLKDKYEITVL